MLTFALLFASVPIVPAGETFACTPTAVWDGDGPVWCAEGPRVRLAGIAAREADGSCIANQPCPDATAEQARDTLAALIGTPGDFSTHAEAQRPARPLGRGGNANSPCWSGPLDQDGQSA